MAVDRQIVVLASDAIAFEQRVAVQFVNSKVRNCTFKLQRSGSHDWAAADVNLAGRVIDMTHVADLLGFTEAAAGTQVRLNQINDVVFKERTEAPACVDTFAGGNRNIDAVLDLLELAGIKGHHGLFISGDAEFFDHVAEFNG